MKLIHLICLTVIASTNAQTNLVSTNRAPAINGHQRFYSNYVARIYPLFQVEAFWKQRIDQSASLEATQWEAHQDTSGAKAIRQDADAKWHAVRSQIDSIEIARKQYELSFPAAKQYAPILHRFATAPPTNPPTRVIIEHRSGPRVNSLQSSGGDTIRSQ